MVIIVFSLIKDKKIFCLLHQKTPHIFSRSVSMKYLYDDISEEPPYESFRTFWPCLRCFKRCDQFFIATFRFCAILGVMDTKLVNPCTKKHNLKQHSDV